MPYNTKDYFTVEEIESMVNPSAKNKTMEVNAELSVDRSFLDRISFIEEIVFKMIEELRDKNLINKSFGRYQGLPVGLLLYSKYNDKDRGTRKTLKIEEGTYVLNNGIKTNSLHQAMKLVCSESEDPWLYWRVGGHRGPSLGEIYGYLCPKGGEHEQRLYLPNMREG
jgi:hypothetical protein